MSIIFDDHKQFEYSIPVIVIGAGGCGLCAALAVKENNTDVLVIKERSNPLRHHSYVYWIDTWSKY
ncbi:MAG: hypothetical protein CM1200mP17_11180 [Woeseia sp.]|nr:MAG: hypothetical protein CM1200mP17_11180 [Woeseia sp.]